MKTSFSKRSLEKLPTKDKRYSVFDSETNGLGLAVYPSVSILTSGSPNSRRSLAGTILRHRPLTCKVAFAGHSHAPLCRFCLNQPILRKYSLVYFVTGPPFCLPPIEFPTYM
jgi:hypothetical protein